MAGNRRYVAFLPLFLSARGLQTHGMDFLNIFPALAAAAVVGLSGLGVMRLLRSDGFHSVPPPAGTAAWTADALPSVPYAGAFRDTGS
jgi:hypothetical protein